MREMDHKTPVGWCNMVQNMVAHVLCLVVQWHFFQMCYAKRKITYTMSSGRERNREETMMHIMSSEEGRNIVSMGPVAFLGLSQMLERQCYLKPTRWANVEE
ncbi:unnamed protein product [Cuscuta europaea]|uniref:Uncharacterized protein n=1 Tax=Cuscuta europaea TaxID=41803 RepID=A0A9P0ZSR8_CUSEU|nr:unnamed protein product [Cuscuta europaea]